MSNTNCLEGMACPKCGEEEPFNIEMKSVFTIYDQGTDSYGDTEWGDESYCECLHCHFYGTVANFKQEQEPTERRRDE